MIILLLIYVFRNQNVSDIYIGLSGKKILLTVIKNVSVAPSSREKIQK